jgi:hypothetical protein
MTAVAPILTVITTIATFRVASVSATGHSAADTSPTSAVIVRVNGSISRFGVATIGDAGAPASNRVEPGNWPNCRDLWSPIREPVVIHPAVEAVG